MPRFEGKYIPKIPRFGTTIFAVMSRLAGQHGAINLSQGFPDFPVSNELIDRVNHYMKKGCNQYAPMQGIPELRRAIADKVESIYGVRYNPEEEINITAGATQALYTVISCAVHPGDEVILFTPVYDSYAPAVEINGGISIDIPLKRPDYSIDWDAVRKKVGPRTRMIIINTPHNPTGSTLSQEDMEQLDDITRGTDILVLSDEVYEHIIFDGKVHQSILRYSGLIQRSFVVFSFGKTFHVTGWKMGYCLAPANLMKEFRQVHQFMVYACNTPIQYAFADFLKQKENYEGIGDFYQKKRDLFLKLIKNSRFRFKPASGSYFQLLEYGDITREKDTQFAERLTKEYGVASIPVSVFYPRPVDFKVLRFCFAKTEETLEKAAAILSNI
ncbi:MAG: methionine aminotransferase [Candidatus Aminicenantes bacterium]|nr:methionine aminotransferase [Candidatus Aminicenantes bacterium]